MGFHPSLLPAEELCQLMENPVSGLGQNVKQLKHLLHRVAMGIRCDCLSDRWEGLISQPCGRAPAGLVEGRIPESRLPSPCWSSGSEVASILQIKHSGEMWKEVMRQRAHFCFCEHPLPQQRSLSPLPTPTAVHSAVGALRPASRGS